MRYCDFLQERETKCANRSDVSTQSCDDSFGVSAARNGDVDFESLPLDAKLESF